MKIYIGTSGWQYYHWKVKFYPENLPSKDFLRFYSKYCNTVEINTSFCHFTKKSTFEKWVTQINTDFERINTDKNYQRINSDSKLIKTDKDDPHKSVSNLRKSVNFLFSIKLHRLFIHFLKLKLNKDDKRILKETIESYKVLGKNLGSILIQLPPSLKKDLKVLEKFLKCFNYPNRKPNKLSEYKPNKKSFGPDSGKKFGRHSGNIKLTIEFRHKSWLDKETYNFLKKKKNCFCYFRFTSLVY